MITSTKQRAKVTLKYSGDKNGPYTYGGLIADCTDEGAHTIGKGINAVQTLPAAAILKTVESKLESI